MPVSWKPKVSIYQLVKEMVNEATIKKLNKNEKKPNINHRFKWNAWQKFS